MNKINLKKLRIHQFRKQRLIEKAPPAEFLDVLQEQIGLHSTDYLTPYLSLWARVRHFDPKNLFDSLCTDLAVRLRAFRGTLFVTHSEHMGDLLDAMPVFHKAKQKEARRYAAKFSIDLDAARENVCDILGSGRTATTGAMRQELDSPIDGELFTLVVRSLELDGTITRRGPRYFSDRRIQWQLSGSRFAGLARPGEERAVESLTLKYITRFGPVCLDDICWWFPASKTMGRDLLSRLQDRVQAFGFNGREYFMMKDDYESLLAFEVPEPEKQLVCLLPYEDHFGKSFIRREWYLAQETVPLVTLEGRMNAGQLRPTVWLDGEIVGRWEWKLATNSGTRASAELVALREDLADSEVRAAVDRRLEAVETFINDELVPLMKEG